jgi:hypothetical protein
MRMAVGALLGLVLGTAIVAAIGLAFNNYAYAGSLAAGLLAGVLMRGLTGLGGAVYAKGALAAMATAAAAILGPFVQTQWFHSQFNNLQSTAPRIAIQSDAEGDAEAETTTDETVVVTDDRSRSMDNGALRAPLRAPDRDPFATADVACLVIGCLAAYQIGKGPMPAPPEDQPDGDTPHNKPSNLPPVD